MQLDHLVYAVPDLDQAIRSLESKLGLTASRGGRHSGLGTENAILPLEGDCYLELIAADRTRDARTHPRPFGLDELDTARLVTWAVRSQAIESDVEIARDRGYEPGVILEMSRESPEAGTLRWRLTIRSEPLGDGLIPFVIDWGDAPHPSGESDSEIPRARLARFAGRHPDPGIVRRALAAMDVEFEVETAERPGFTARLEGPAGHLDLD